MKHFYTFLIALLVGGIGFSQTTADGWINEIHYDDIGGDNNEGVEIVVADIATYPLANWSVVPYNGSNGNQYNPQPNFSSPDAQSTTNGFTIAHVDLVLQNGGPDGIALLYNSTVVQFISYEGTFTANNGPASGQLSVSIGVNETNSTPEGQSLQLSGSGNSYSDFTWQPQATATAGSLNNGQTLVAASTNDTDTEIYDPASQVSDATIIAANSNTLATAVNAFIFTVEDQGTSDGLFTRISKMRFAPGPNNSTDWADHIQGIEISPFSFSNTPYTPTVTIEEDEIILDFAPLSIFIGDGDSLDFYLKFYLNSNNITDGGIIQLQIDAANSGFEALTTGSSFSNPLFLGDVVGPEMTIDVDATEIRFVQQPTNSQETATMAPAVTVAGTDANGNIDTAYNLGVNITSSGTLNASPLNETAVNGVATFSNIIHIASGSGLMLTAADGLYTDAVSTAFNITASTVCIIEQDFDTNTSWSYTNAIPFFDNGWGFGFYGIRDISTSFPLDYSGLSNNVLAENDINDIPDGTTGFARITFDEIDISIYSDVVLTFDWDVEGYNANADDARYRLDYDGSNQPYVFLLDGNGTPEDGEGTVSINIPNTVDEVRLIIEVRNNGQTGYSAFDNFKLTGIPPAAVEYVYNNGWTPSNPSGVINKFDNISVTAGNASGAGNIVFGDIEVNNLTISSGAGIDLRQDGGIKVYGTLNNAGNLVIRSNSTRYGSLIADNVTNTGQLIYRRTTNGYTGSGANDLISAPFYGSTFGDFAQFQQNEDNLFADPNDASVRLFGPFDKSSNGGEYLLYDEDVPANAAVVLTSGIGYRAATDPASASSSAGILVFEGEMETGSFSTPISISGTNSPEWNIIGNPYPSYITFAEFFSTNNAEFDDDSVGVYGYNGNVSDKWTIWNQATIDDGTVTELIAPGQGFAVSSKNASGSITFNPTMRSIGSPTDDDFIAGRNSNVNDITNTISHLKIEIANSSKTYDTDFYFTQNASQGLDRGYDASMFSNIAPEFSIYSHLVQDNDGVDMAIQSLGDSDLANVSIPLGVNANQGEQLTFSISETSLPSSVNIYLDDNVSNTSTLLNSGDYILTPSVTLNGIGRFYLRISNSSLSTNDNVLDNLNIYTNNTNKTIVIAGQLLESTKASVYDLQGRLVTSSLLDASKRNQYIDVSQLSTGVYVVQLSNSNKTQKVIIR